MSRRFQTWFAFAKADAERKQDGTPLAAFNTSEGKEFARKSFEEMNLPPFYVDTMEKCTGRSWFQPPSLLKRYTTKGLDLIETMSEQIESQAKEIERLRELVSEALRIASFLEDECGDDETLGELVDVLRKALEESQ